MSQEPRLTIICKNHWPELASTMIRLHAHPHIHASLGATARRIFEGRYTAGQAVTRFRNLLTSMKRERSRLARNEKEAVLDTLVAEVAA